MTTEPFLIEITGGIMGYLDLPETGSIDLEYKVLENEKAIRHQYKLPNGILAIAVMNKGTRNVRLEIRYRENTMDLGHTDLIDIRSRIHRGLSSMAFQINNDS